MDKRISGVIAPAFYPVHRMLRESGGPTHFWLAGGRGSGKSTFAAAELLLGLMREPDVSAVVLRKVGATLRDSVMDQLLWTADALGVRHLWEQKLAPPLLLYRPTGQRILFRGADDPRKLKSLRPERGFFRYVWFEEADEFAGPDELRSINQSLLRGGEGFRVFYTMNPPKSRSHWINRELEAAALRSDTLVHRSDYRGMPPDWLGEAFLAEAERLRDEQPLLYAHEYLGEAVGTGGEVFANICLREIPDRERRSFCKIKRGIDWGYGADPFVYIEAEYQKAQRKLLIFSEFYSRRAGFDEVAAEIRKRNPLNAAVTADSAEPRSNDELKRRGLRVYPAKKGPGSVSHGICWLQNLREIVIDPRSCPNAAREFGAYTLSPDGRGGFLPGFPDRDNHTIDAVRYACEREMVRGGLGFE